MEPTVLVTMLAGSRLYGTAHEGSDYDVRGVAVEPLSWMLGVRQGKLAPHLVKDGEDTMTHGLQAFAQAVAKGSPNAWEMLCTPPDFWLTSSQHWLTWYTLRNGWINQQTLLAHAGASTNMWSEAVRTSNWKHMAQALRYASQGRRLALGENASPRLPAEMTQALRDLRLHTGGMEAPDVAMYKSLLDADLDAMCKHALWFPKCIDSDALNDMVVATYLAVHTSNGSCH